MSYRKILVPVDGSATSREGLREAIAVARAQGAALGILHVIDPAPAPQLLEGGLDFRSFELSVRKAGNDILADALAVATKGGVKAESMLAETRGYTTAEVIVARARRWCADLIILGTHGRTGLKRLLIGSCAEAVLRNTRLPVLLVPGPAHRQVRPPARRAK